MLEKAMDWEAIAETGGKVRSVMAAGSQERDGTDYQRHGCDLNQNPEPAM